MWSMRAPSILVLLTGLLVFGSGQHPAIQRELERSALRFRAKSTKDEVFAYIKWLASHRQHKSTIFMLKGRAVVFREVFLQMRKRIHHTNMVLSAAAMHNGVRNVSVAYSFISESTGLEERHEDRPALVICKKKGYQAPGLLVPNPYFAGGLLFEWSKEIEELKRYSNANKWIERDSRIFWRGNLMKLDDCEQDSGNFARVSAMTLSLNAPTQFDIKCRHCLIHDLTQPYPKKQCTTPRFIDATLKQLTSRNITPVQDIAFYQKERYAHNKGLLNLPGTTQGGYSRNLNDLWFLGAVIFFWSEPFVEFYFPALSPGKTHIVINTTNAVHQAAILNDHQASLRLIDQAQYVADNILCPQCLASYMAAVFQILHRRFSLALVLDDASSLGRAFEEAGVDCSRDLVELSLHHRAPGKGFQELSFPSEFSCTEILRSRFGLS